MPTLARWYIKTALGCMAIALLAGVALAPVLGYGPATAVLYHAYFHLFVVGWLTQLIFGVAFWLFPRFSREAPHGNERPVGAAYVLLNAGLLLRAAAVRPCGRPAEGGAGRSSPPPRCSGPRRCCSPPLPIIYGPVCGLWDLLTVTPLNAGES